MTTLGKNGKPVGRPHGPECGVKTKDVGIGAHPHCRKTANVAVTVEIKGRARILNRCYKHYVAFEQYARAHPDVMHIVSVDLLKE